ncbi:uncharacterized protein LOC127290085 [Leptopilina boulardi]|uniref:uncharacterized protein LOC127290085 n=1 Tax=Leptopilina boulardi TaxID=63433 RepID=UPI0021F506A9|nr:uncharacterized protein LOC127290085 [Leptopilina boulardi]
MDFANFLFNDLDNSSSSSSSSSSSEDEGIDDKRLQCYIGNIAEITEISYDKRSFRVKSFELTDTVPNDTNLFIRINKRIINIGQVGYSFISRDNEAIHKTDGIYLMESIRNLLALGMEVFADEMPCPPTRIEKRSFSDMLYEATRLLKIQRDANPSLFHSSFFPFDKPIDLSMPNDDDEPDDNSHLALWENMDIGENNFFYDTSSTVSSSPTSSPTSAAAAAMSIITVATASSEFNCELPSTSSAGME